MLPAVAIPLLLSSCAMMLNGNQQEVKIETPKENATIYVDHEKEGSGSSVSLRLRRNMNIRQVRVASDGHLPAYKTIAQTERPWLYYLSWFPFGPPTLFFVPTLDQKPNSFDFKDRYVIDTLTRFPQRNQDQKYLRPGLVLFNLQEEDMAYRRFRNYEDFTKNEDPYERSNPDEAMEGRVKYIQERLQKALQKYDYQDTTQVFTHKLNTLECDVSYDNLTINLVSPFSNANQIYQGYGQVAVRLTNIYGEQLYEDSMIVRSGEFFAEDFGENNFRKVTQQMGVKAVARFLQKPEFQQTLKREEGKDQDFEPLALRPGKVIDTLQEAQKATVTVAIGEKGHGSGCVVGRKGYIVTNYHVVANHEDELTVTQGQQGEQLEAEVIRKNAYADLALIKVDKQFAYTYRIPEQKTFETGMTAYTIGTPESRALRQSFTKGIISGKRAQRANTYLQTDASVNPGNSGGALVDQKGRLHGIVTSKLMGVAYEGISFSLSADLVDDRLGLQYQEGSAAASQQKPQKGSQQPSR
jgi:S1-C subfamily serine protease